MQMFQPRTGQNSRLPIEKLFLTSNELHNESARALADNLMPCAPRLRALYLSLNLIGTEGALSLATAIAVHGEQLELLELSGNRITNQGGEALVRTMSTCFKWTDLTLTTNLISNFSLLRRARFYGKLNAAGRYLLLDQNLPRGLWPHVLARMNLRLDVRFYFLQRLPELFVPQ